MRKTLGALRRQLVEQFFGEALITSSLAFIIAIALVTVTMPFFNHFAGKFIQTADVWTLQWLGSTFLLVIFISFCAGAYPALFLARLKPVSSLKGSGSLRVAAPVVRKGLIVFQFMCLSILSHRNGYRAASTPLSPKQRPRLR